MKQTMKLTTRDMHSICTKGLVSSSRGTTKEFDLFRYAMTIVSLMILESGNVNNSGKQGSEILIINPDSFRYHPIRKI